MFTCSTDVHVVQETVVNINLAFSFSLKIYRQFVIVPEKDAERLILAHYMLA